MAEEDEENPGFITKSFANPWISVPYSILSGLAAGATPGTARASRGINEGLSLGIGAEKYQTEQKRKKRLNESLSKLSEAKEPAVRAIGMEPSTTTYSLPASQRLSEALPEGLFASPKDLPTYEKVPEKPLFNARQQEYLKLVDSDAGMRAIGSNLFKEQRAPHVFGSSETGYHALGDSGTVTPLVAGVPRAVRESTPPRPVFATQGGEAVESVFDPIEKKWVTTRSPSTAAPARQLSPEEAANLRARTGLIPAQAAHLRAQTAQATAQAARIAEAAKLLKDPTLTKEKLTTMRAGLLREKDMLEKGIDADTPENQQRVADIDTLLDDSRARLAALIKRDNPAPGAKTGSDPKDPLGIRKK